MGGSFLSAGLHPMVGVIVFDGVFFEKHCRMGATPISPNPLPPLWETLQYHIVTHLSLAHMIVNIGNIAQNEKTIAAKENLKVTYTSFILDCFVFVMNCKVTYINILFFHINFLLYVNLTYTQGDL